MVQRIISLVYTCLFALQTVLSTLPVSPAAAEQQNSNSLDVPRSAIWSKTVFLDRKNPSFRVAGIELTFDHERTRSTSVLARVDCFASDDTPPLKLDVATHGRDAHLVNMTRVREGDCASFEVATVSSDAIAFGTSATTGSPTIELAVALHHSGKLLPDAVGNPSVFLFNPVYGNWTEAKGYSPTSRDPKKAYATLADSFQRIIVGVISKPEALQSEPTSNSPSSLAAPLDQISAADGYLSVSDFEPDNKGAYGTKLPMLLRSARGPGPSFSVAYSSKGAAGVLGRGWDLLLSSIEVRGPAPIYHPDFETEDYVLDGMDLIALDGNGRDMAPLYKGGPIVRRNKEGVRFFRPRDNSNPLILRRYGSGPSSYFWEVWNPTTHVTRLYGGEFQPKGKPPRIASDSNGLLRGEATFSGEVTRNVIGQWGLTQEYDNQPARTGTSYSYHQADACAKGLPTGCRSALRLAEVEYSKTFETDYLPIDRSGETQVVFNWEPRDPLRQNSDGRLGYLRGYQHWLKSITVKYRPNTGNLWLASNKTSDQVEYSTHEFGLSAGDDPCLNYDVVLKTYTVNGNPRYDQVSPDKGQVFTFDYDGEKYTSGGKGLCSREWSAPQAVAKLGDLNSGAPAGAIGFPSDLLNDLGFDRLTRQSFLGTGRIEETGASVFLGVGPAGDTSVKPISGGFKGGQNFTKSETNSALVDVTGDGIDDIVARQGSRLRYCGGQRDAVTHFVSYPTERCGWIEGIADLALSSTSTFSAGAEVTAYGSIFAGVGFNRSKNDSYIYFTDRDADGLIDLVAYGQVYYGLGETVQGTTRTVRFALSKALTPPLPGGARVAEAEKRLPQDLRATILDIESRLEATAAQLQTLDYSQITLAWVAPLDGAVTLAGLFERGEVDPTQIPIAGVDPKFDPQAFEELFDEVETYKKYAYSCSAWPEKEFCHRRFSDPYGAQYTRAAEEFSFIRTFPGHIRISISRRRATAPITCFDETIGGKAHGSIEIGDDDYPFDQKCRPADGALKKIGVRSGDVVYLTYSVHPHFAKWLKPRTLIRYVDVENDPAFLLAKDGDEEGVLGRLPCNWSFGEHAFERENCALAQLSPYEFDVRTGALASSPSRAVELPAGTERTFQGMFSIPTWLTENYAVSFEVLARQIAKPDPQAGNIGKDLGPTPIDTLRGVYRLDVSEKCAGQGEICTVTLEPQCRDADKQCAAFVSAKGEHFGVASRLRVEHKVGPAGLAARNIDSILQNVVWIVPPHLKSVFVKPDQEEGKAIAPGAETERYSLVYLPVAMGSEDVEYFRVETAVFSNPDVDMNEGDPQPETIELSRMMELERETVAFARVRQTLELCRYSDEILTYLRNSFASHATPYAEGYLDHWDIELGNYFERCVEAESDYARATFTSNKSPDPNLTERLNLSTLLRNLSYEARIASAETLLRRVLTSLSLGDQFLTDEHRLTRRGYRLPIKVNPLDCDMLGGKVAPLTEPIIDQPGRRSPDCAYRLLTNFSMQDFEDLIGETEAAELRQLLSPLSSSTVPAFKVELAATVNGYPIPFQELTGAATGNDPCTPATPNTCIGNYGTTGLRLGSDGKPIGVKEYLYPKGDPGDPATGDVLQRISTNKRTGRAVAFSNSIMSPGVSPACKRNFPLYETGWQMEAKQDCLFEGSDITNEQKYAPGGPKYTVSYEILENNLFIGRNRVLEFRARPLDIVEFQVRIVPVEQVIDLDEGNSNSKVQGAFSVLRGTSGNGLRQERHLISRSPSDILPSPGDALPPDVKAQYNCKSTVPGRLPKTCRPWSQLGWVELLLGAQYRTYSDAQKTLRQNEYSILRRREILRLQPEIEVSADRYFLEQTGDDAVLVSEIKSRSSPDIAALNKTLKDPALPQGLTVNLPSQYFAFHRREPNVYKTGGSWAFFGARAPPNGLLREEPAFQVIRFGVQGKEFSEGPGDAYTEASGKCGTELDPKYDDCENQLSGKGQSSLALTGYEIFALEHRFVGPVDGGPFPGNGGPHEENEKVLRTGIGQCSVARPNTTASCWRGPDDSIFLEETLPSTGGERNDLHSVSALVGFERPPLAQFLFEFNSYKRLACLDPVFASSGASVSSCPKPPAAASVEPALEYPNRPNPPDVSATVTVYAPVQASKSRTISRNVGALLFNKNSSNTTREQTTAYLDVNGDGYPEVVSGGHAELTSPVGLSRRDWWRYFRVEENTPSLTEELGADGLSQNGDSFSSGQGIGLSPSTFAVFKQKGPKTKESGSPDAVLDPSFSLDEENGYDSRFTELRDFNGDGLADSLTGGTVGEGVKLGLSVGNAIVPATESGGITAGGAPVSGEHYNTNHSAGFGVRLGFSVEAGSYGAGMGLAHRGAGSKAALMDFTGDGRPDIVVPADRVGGNGNLLVFPNLGNGFGKGRWHLITQHKPTDTSFTETTIVDAGGFYTYGFNVWIIKVVVNVGAKHSRGQIRELLNIRDVNGDGFPDLAMVQGTFQDLGGQAATVHYNPEARYHLLTGVTNPSGSKFLLSHSLYGNEGAANGSPIWALTEVARYDGFEPRNAHKVGPLADDGDDVTLTRYDYETGYFNRAERQFYGFARRTTTTFGCDLAGKGQNCLGVFNGAERLTERVLAKAGYRKLQLIDQQFSNRDYLTQGVVVSQSVQGFETRSLDKNNKPVPAGDAQVISMSRFSYSLEHLAHHAKIPDPGQCETPRPTDLLTGSWSPGDQATGSILPELWDGSKFQSSMPLFGTGGLCISGDENCVQKLKENICRSGFMREQQAFWAQQSGSRRQRLESLEIFAGDTPPEAALLLGTPRLRSQVGFDYDQWGQVETFNSIGEADSEWHTAPSSSAHAKIEYALRQGLNASVAAAATGYPLLGLPEQLTIFDGAWPTVGYAPKTLRTRQALYSKDGRGNLTDVCAYPLAGMAVSPQLCQTYKDKLRKHLGDGYSSLQAALRATYKDIDELPEGASEFDAIIHHQFVSYDEFGNLTHTISPLTASKEWIERRFHFEADPFRRTATTTALTRCVEDVAGVGTDSAGTQAIDDRCSFGFDDLPEPIRRVAVTHISTGRVDTHHGTVAETRDINGNSILVDLDRWGRLRLIARGWGNAARENRTYAAQLRLAIAKSALEPRKPQEIPTTDDWRLLALADYERLDAGLLRSNLRKFEPSDSYSGLIEAGKTTRESAQFADGNGRVIQILREADVCLDVPDQFISGSRNVTNDGNLARPTEGLVQRCKSYATAIATPSSAIDGLGRKLLSFEPYAALVPDAAGPPSQLPRFLSLAKARVRPEWLSRSVYDGAGRPTRVESRLAVEGAVPSNRVRGAAQYRYRVVPPSGSGPARRLARFEAMTLSPRCSASAAWTDARGLTRTVFEQQSRTYPESNRLPTVPAFATANGRDYELSWGDCDEIGEVAKTLGPQIEKSATSEWPYHNGDATAPSPQPVRVSYAYDALQQLTDISYPLAGQARALINVRYDLLGRMRELHEPNSGCTSYRHDPLNLLVSVQGFRFEPQGKACGSTFNVRNEKSYRYAGDRLIEMSYRSLEEQGGADDQRDTVRFYYDKYPHAAASGELLEAQRYVPNDDANRRFIDVTGRDCSNCVGQVALLSDRTGARSFAYNEIGLAGREVRSLVGPLNGAGLKHSDGGSEDYLPELAFHEVQNSYTAMGDLVQQRFSESAPSNPHEACIKAGVENCIARFSIGRKYSPNGAIAQLLFNGRPLVNAAQDALGRPSIRWTADGTATGYRYDSKDLRLNQLATLTAGIVGDTNLPVQVNDYQYDGGGNVLAYTNRALPEEDYEAGFGFGYDAVNRLIGFAATARNGKDSFTSSGRYAYDEGHRFVSRTLSIEGIGRTSSKLQRVWRYQHRNNLDEGPLHAPERIEFWVNDVRRDMRLAYDDVGRMTRIGAEVAPNLVDGLLTNRAMSWDAEGRLIRVRGVADQAADTNAQWLREDYVYDAGGNRALRIHRPRVDASGEAVDEDKAATATIYLTPFYAKTLDRRGTVQLAQGNLPTAALDAPTDGSEVPIVTYIYSDLMVGSMTASVTAYGQAHDAGSIVIGRREYSPYGLELTADGFAGTGRPGASPMSVFHGKELDRISNFSSFGARSYSRDLGIWLSPDPMMAGYLTGQPAGGVYAPSNLSGYAFARLSPTVATDYGGAAVETPWDAFNVALGVVNLGANVAVGNYWSAALDLAGVSIDVAATGAPAIPGGANTVITMGRVASAANKVRQSAQRFNTLVTSSKAGRIASKIERNLTDHLSLSDIAGAVKDIMGKPIAKAGGGSYKHIDEVTFALKGLKNQIRELSAILQKGGMNRQQTIATEKLLSDTSKHVDRVEKILNVARDVARKIGD